MDQLFQILSDNDGKKYRLVFGNTGQGMSPITIIIMCLIILDKLCVQLGSDCLNFLMLIRVMCYRNSHIFLWSRQQQYSNINEVKCNLSINSSIPLRQSLKSYYWTCYVTNHHNCIPQLLYTNIKIYSQHQQIYPHV